jgi:hypothetical protein
VGTSVGTNGLHRGSTTPTISGGIAQPTSRVPVPGFMGRSDLHVWVLCLPKRTRLAPINALSNTAGQHPSGSPLSVTCVDAHRPTGGERCRPGEWNTALSLARMGLVRSRRTSCERSGAVSLATGEGWAGE